MSDSKFPPASKIAGVFVISLATALGGGTVALFGTWSKGLANQGDVEKARDGAIARCAEMLSEKLGPRPGSSDPLYDRVILLEGARISLVERLGLETRARVGFQVALHYASDPRRKASADEKSRAARAKFDQLVMGGVTPAVAAETVLEQAGVPR